MRARSDFLAATLVAILALLGASALAPAPAAAMVNDEEESPCTVDWFFYDGEECSGQGSGGGSSEGDSTSEGDGYYDDSGDACADYGDCWDEWGEADDDGGFGESSGDDIVDGPDPEDEEDRLVRALEEQAARASAEYLQCRELDLDLAEADEVLASLVEGDRQAGSDSGVKGSIQIWLRTRDLTKIERDECYAHADAALDRVYDERERLGLPRSEGGLFHRDEEDIEKALGFTERTGASGATAPPSPAAVPHAALDRHGLISKAPERSDRPAKKGQGRRAKKARARR